MLKQLAEHMQIMTFEGEAVLRQLAGHIPSMPSTGEALAFAKEVVYLFINVSVFLQDKVLCELVKELDPISYLVDLMVKLGPVKDAVKFDLVHATQNLTSGLDEHTAKKHWTIF